MFCIAEQSLQMWQSRGFGPRRHERKNPTGSFKKEKQGKDGGRQEKEREKKNRDFIGFKASFDLVWPDS